MEILLLLVLILINGLFSMSEIALVSARKFKLENAARRGSKGARKALELSESPSRFLSTVQIGITLISILTGLYSGEVLTVPLTAKFAEIPFIAPYAETLATVIVLVAITYFSVVLGELFPKRIGLSFPESIAGAAAIPMNALAMVTAPFVWLLSRSNDLLLKIVGISSRTDAIVTEEEIRSMLSESAQSGQIQEIEQDIVERVFALGDRKVNTLMTHRSDIVWLDVADDPAEIRRKIGADLHGAFPVGNGELDDLLGLVLLKDLFHDLDRPGFVLKDALVQPILAPPSSSAYRLLEQFREKRFHYAIVVDEFGSVQGLITMDDILDALVGDVSEAGQEEYAMAAESANSWLADGQYPFFEFLRMLDLDEAEFVHEDYSTLAGFLITQMDRIPQVGDSLVWRGFRFEVLSMIGRKVEKLRIVKVHD
ncbi:MAG: hypothetical protein RL742_1153 [Bacteroidota bacterium]|jgi:putative hemolysin